MGDISNTKRVQLTIGVVCIEAGRKEGEVNTPWGTLRHGKASNNFLGLIAMLIDLSMVACDI